MVKTLGLTALELSVYFCKQTFFGNYTLFWELPLSPSPKLDSSILHLYCLKTTLNRLVLAEASVILGPDLGPDFWGSKFSF